MSLFFDLGLRGGEMTFRLVHAKFERNSKRAYVELRKDDADGGEMIVAVIFTFRRTSILTSAPLKAWRLMPISHE